MACTRREVASRRPACSNFKARASLLGAWGDASAVPEACLGLAEVALRCPVADAEVAAACPEGVEAWVAEAAAAAAAASAVAAIAWVPDPQHHLQRGRT